MSRKDATIGIDLGGTKINIGVVDSFGKVQGRLLISTRAALGQEAILEDICAAVRDLTNQYSNQISGVGVGVAGQVDPKNGEVLFAPNLKWKKVPLGQLLQQRCKIPCKIANDVRAATVGEWLYGAGRGCKEFISLFIGTGIGGCAISAGEVLTGSSNSAGEFGHMVLQMDGPLCTCGNRGCFEALAGGWAIGHRLQEKVKQDTNAAEKFLTAVGGQKEALSAKELFAAYSSKDSLAIELVEEIKKALAAGVVSLVNAFNPERVILGGGVIEKNPFLFAHIREKVPQMALQAAAKKLTIVQAELKGDAGMIGAAALCTH